MFLIYSIVISFGDRGWVYTRLYRCFNDAKAVIRKSQEWHRIKTVSLFYLHFYIVMATYCLHPSDRLQVAVHVLLIAVYSVPSL